MGRIFLCVFFWVFIADSVFAQKQFEEGTLVYKVQVISAKEDGAAIQTEGIYTFLLKGKELRKELQLNNGYEDILVYNGYSNSFYSLHNLDGKKYAIQLSMDDLAHKKQQYTGFTLHDAGSKESINGYAAVKAIVSYPGGSTTELYYATDWSVENEIMFDLFPSIKVIPLVFNYKGDNGMTMSFRISKLKSEPLENANFRIPPDYKIISYKEYKQLNKTVD